MKRTRAAAKKFNSTDLLKMQGFLHEGPEEQKRILRSLVSTIHRFFGGVDSLFSGVTDPRDPKKTVYPLAGLAFTGILMYLCHLKARRQIGLLLRTGAATETFQSLFDVDRCPHGDTSNDAFCDTSPEEVQQEVCRLLNMLIRKKVLYRYRVLDKYFVVAGDGTGTLTFPERHCPHCLTQTQHGKTTYYHQVLDLKLVTSNGFAFSMMTNFIENPGVKPNKQDCELKAFYRLAPQLKKSFPRLPILLALDGLFACGPVFHLCTTYGWKFMIVLKDKDLPSVNQEFEALWQLERGNRLIWKTRKEGDEVKQVFRWVNGIPYTDSNGREHILSVIECLEMKLNSEGEWETTKFKWVTNFRVTATNVVSLANEGGRRRWKIENQGFKAQKTGGFELEHSYTSNPTSAKIFYYLLQIAHMIEQLLYQGCLVGKQGRRALGSRKNLGFRLLEAWRNTPLKKAEIEEISMCSFQIRFCPDTS